VASPWSLERTPEGISVVGEIDLAGAEDFVEEFCVVARDAPRPLLVDMTGVTFMDSSGIIALTRVAAALGTSQIVVLPSRQVFRLLEVAGLAKEGAWDNVTVLPAD
jgi:anti-anti-sigma factor